MACGRPIDLFFCTRFLNLAIIFAAFWFPSKEIVDFGHFLLNPFHSTPTTVLATPELVYKFPRDESTF
jgi:hypothetical protein